MCIENIDSNNIEFSLMICIYPFKTFLNKKITLILVYILREILYNINIFPRNRKIKPHINT